MKQILCILATLAVSAGLLFLVSAPVNNQHGAADEHGEGTHAEAVAGEEAAQASAAH